jgi:hypothetical protein
MQAKREKNHNNSNHAPISTFTHNKIRPLSPVLAAPQPLAATGFEAIENKYLDGKTTLNCSDKTAAVIDEEVIKMLKESYIKTKGMLQNNLECLHKVSEYLLEKESITGKEFMEIVNSVKNKNEESDNND